MKAVIKAMWVDSPDIILDSYRPDDLGFFGLWINLRIGPDDSEGAHDYQLLVCSPNWLKSECISVGVLWGRHMLIVNEYDIYSIKDEISKCINSYSGEEWGEVAKKIARFAAWEYEDYKV